MEWRNYVEKLPEGVIFLNSNGKPSYFNDALKEIMKASNEEEVLDSMKQYKRNKL
jgi:PAS domain-containing protein